MEKSFPLLANDVFSVGIKDWNRRIFDALIPLQHGTSYNSYLTKGNEKIALIDAVALGFEDEFLKNISSIVDIKKLDYLIMNHAEPDHTGAIPFIMERCKAKLVVTEKGAQMAKLYYKINDDRIKIVRDNEAIDLGGKTLKFIEAPWLHWPETMFSYLVEDKILFSCDFFGQHTAFGIYDSDVNGLIDNAQKYFGEIMMPFKSMGKKAMEKIKDFEIKIIAPSHGPIHKNPSVIIDCYKKWTNRETKNKVLVVYATMWGSTEKMIKHITDILSKEEIEVSLYNLTSSDIGDIAKDMVDSKAIVLGCPTVLGNLHPLAVYAAYLVKALKPPVKYAVFLNSYGWGAGASKKLLEIIGENKIEVIGALEVNGPPNDGDFEKINEIGILLSKKIKSR